MLQYALNGLLFFLFFGAISVGFDIPFRFFEKPEGSIAKDMEETNKILEHLWWAVMICICALWNVMIPAFVVIGTIAGLAMLGAKFARWNRERRKKFLDPSHTPNDPELYRK
jgi:hypothetical protein